MRFSSIFQHRAPPEQVRPEEKPTLEETQAPAVGPVLPEELDARVRLLGEWQVFES